MTTAMERLADMAHRAGFDGQTRRALAQIQWSPVLTEAEEMVTRADLAILAFQAATGGILDTPRLMALSSQLAAARHAAVVVRDACITLANPPHDLEV